MRKILKNFLYFLSVTTFLFPCQVFAESPEQKEALKLIKNLEQKYHSAASFSADFIQQIYPPYTTSPSTEATGRFIFSKPCLMRWEYTSPDEQVIVIYPSVGWLYSVREKEVQVFDPAEFYRSVVARAFLKDILDSFDVVGFGGTSSEASTGQAATVSILLKPREDSGQIAQIELVIQKPEILIAKIIGEDQAGTRNVLIFTRQSWDNPSSPEAFMPSFPNDVTISNDRGETISYDAFIKQFKDKKGDLNCSHDPRKK